jgi:hypothetical protein
VEQGRAFLLSHVYPYKDFELHSKFPSSRDREKDMSVSMISTSNRLRKDVKFAVSLLTSPGTKNELYGRSLDL